MNQCIDDAVDIDQSLPDGLF